MFPSTSKVREIARKILLKSVHYNTIKTTELTTRIDEVNTRSGKIISKVRQARLPSTNLGTTENLQHHRLFIVIMHISPRKFGRILRSARAALHISAAYLLLFVPLCAIFYCLFVCFVYFLYSVLLSFLSSFL